jgi:hypothetical protein
VLDGADVAAASFSPIADTSWSYAQLRVDAGAHRIHGPVSFGLTSYGWDFFDAYSWPGGTRLAPVADVASVDLTPASSTVTVGDQHCLLATVSDADGRPVAGVRLDWTVSGTHADAGSGQADGAGRVEICLRSDTVGADTVTAEVSTIADTATVTWTDAAVNHAPVAQTQDLVTAEDSEVPLVLGASDVDGDDLAFTITRAPAHGRLTGIAPHLTYQPDHDYAGVDDFSFRVCDNGLTHGQPDPLCDSATVGLRMTPVNDAPTVTLAPTNQQVQYSDPITPITVTAADVDNVPDELTATLSWKRAGDLSFVSGPALGRVDVGPSGGSASGAWQVAGRAMVPAGDYVVRVTVSDGSAIKTVDAAVTVLPETAAVSYSGDSMVNTGTGGTATLKLSASVAEAADGSLGDRLGTTSARFTVYRFSDTLLQSPVQTCQGLVHAANGGFVADCQVTGLTSDSYVVVVDLLGNGYYVAPIETAGATVVTPSAGFTTGGGWLIDPVTPTRANFGFNVKSDNTGRVKGQSLYIYRVTVSDRSVRNDTGGFLPAGFYSWIVKSNAISTLSQRCTTSAPLVCTASFAGKANVTAVNSQTRLAYSLGGNFSFQIDVTDAGEPGSSAGSTADQYAVRLLQKDGTLYYRLGTPTNQIRLAGGNIQVRR